MSTDTSLDTPPTGLGQATLALVGGRRRRSSWRRTGYGLLGILLAAALWELLSYVKNDPVILPSVQSTVRTFWDYLGQKYPSVGGKTLWQHALVSGARILAGWSVGVVIGVVIGGVMASLRVVRFILDPLIEITRPLPPLAFIPLFIVWFGIGELPKEVLLVFGIVPIMAVATVAALDEVPDDLRLCARTLGASRGYTLVHVQIPAALPGIVTGMRFAMAGAWTSIVAAEMLAATSGVGYLISQAGNYLNTSLVFAGIITIAIAGLVLDMCLRGLLLLVDPSRRS
jgi:NitT/TauT family transport system permease protein/taurine transport system permease protein